MDRNSRPVLLSVTCTKKVLLLLFLTCFACFSHAKFTVLFLVKLVPADFLTGY